MDERDYIAMNKQIENKNTEMNKVCKCKDCGCDFEAWIYVEFGYDDTLVTDQCENCVIEFIYKYNLI